MDPNERHASLELLHPSARQSFSDLRDDLDAATALGTTPFRWAVFETYRTPWRQSELLRTGKTKAGPFTSAHQFGLAVDFVPMPGGKLSWDVSVEHWDMLRRFATRRGLINTIPWDRAHVEHPLFVRVRQAFF